MKESEVLAEVSNENQTLVAVVQQDLRVVYFYIYPQEAFEERFPVRACWVRNRVAAPQSTDNMAMEQGWHRAWPQSSAVISLARLSLIHN